jgi:hypothetical protein
MGKIRTGQIIPLPTWQVSGQAIESVVQSGPADPDSGDRDAGRVESAHQPGNGSVAIRERKVESQA